MTKLTATTRRSGMAQRLIGLGTGAVLGVLATFGPAAAQGQFTPVVKVNDSAVTVYERNQRMAFLRILNAPGDVQQLAVDQLINERLQLAEAERLGVEADQDAIQTGMAEFAARGNLDLEQFAAFLAQAGIAFETFRDFVTAGIVWRDVARAEFLETVTITETEIDRAYAEAVPEPGEKFLLTEIVLPASSEQSLRASRARADRLSQIATAEEFGDAAKRFSIAPTRLNDGERDWIDVLALPPEVQGVVRATREGRASRPVVLPEQGVAVYFVRDRETIRNSNVGELLEYAAFFVPGGQDEATRIRERVQVCDDLYPIARGLPADQLVREELPTGAVPARYRAELANLDPGEVSTRLTTGNGALVFLMLCNRRNDVPDSVSRAQVADALRNQRIGAYANDLLADLRANAKIEYLR
ncbi:MAG: SurA N-terminal domain-containing protein [Pseudomonadota bacterium]|nr:SurA N-terminal domain-containing protein [Pseudomonadota bacterium]